MNVTVAMSFCVNILLKHAILELKKKINSSIYREHGMECVEYASNDFVDKIEVIAGRSQHFKLNCLIPDQKSDFSSLASFTKT